MCPEAPGSLVVFHVDVDRPMDGRRRRRPPGGEEVRMAMVNGATLCRRGAREKTRAAGEPRHRGPYRAAWVLVLALSGSAACARGLGAEGAVSPEAAKVAEFEAQVAQHVKTGQDGALEVDVKRGAALHAEVKLFADLQKRVLAALESAVKGVKDDDVRARLLGPVVETGDVQAARIVKPYLRQPDPKQGPPLLLAAIAAAAKVPVPETADTLLRLFEDSKHVGVATAALEALGSYGKVRARRVKILETVVKNVQKDQPGGRGSARGGGGIDDSAPPPPPPPDSTGAGARWAALSSVLPKALNALTGQNVPTAAQWFQVVKDTKNLNDLFAG